MTNPIGPSFAQVFGGGRMNIGHAVQTTVYHGANDNNIPQTPTIVREKGITGQGDYAADPRAAAAILYSVSDSLVVSESKPPNKPVPVLLTPQEFIELAKQHRAPDNATVTGNVVLRGDFTLPANLRVEGFLRVDNPNLESLPRGIKVDKNCFLETCGSLEAVPDDLQAEMIFFPVRTKDKTIHVTSAEDLLKLASEADKRIARSGQRIEIEKAICNTQTVNGKIKEVPIQLKGIGGKNTGTLTIQSPGWQAIYDSDPRQDKKQALETILKLSINICLLKMYLG